MQVGPALTAAVQSLGTGSVAVKVVATTGAVGIPAATISSVVSKRKAEVLPLQEALKEVDDILQAQQTQASHKTLEEHFLYKFYGLLTSDTHFGWDAVIKVHGIDPDTNTKKKLIKSCKDIYALTLDSLTKEELEQKEEYVRNYCTLPKKVKDKLRAKRIKWQHLPINTRTDVSSHIHFWKDVLDLTGKTTPMTNIDRLYRYCKMFPETYTKEGGWTTQEQNYLRFCIRAL